MAGFEASYREYDPTNNTFMATIDKNGTIWSITGRERGIVGIDTQRETELIKEKSDIEETLQQYYDRLVELKEIIPEKTPEELAREVAEEQLRLSKEQSEQQSLLIKQQTDMMVQMMATMKSMENKMNEPIVKEELKSNGNDGYNIVANSTENGQVNKGNESSYIKSSNNNGRNDGQRGGSEKSPK